MASSPASAKEALSKAPISDKKSSPILDFEPCQIEKAHTEEIRMGQKPFARKRRRGEVCALSGRLAVLLDQIHLIFEAGRIEHMLRFARPFGGVERKVGLMQ